MGDREIRTTISLFDTDGRRIEYALTDEISPPLFKDFVRILLGLSLPILPCTQSYVGVLDLEKGEFEFRVVHIGVFGRLFSDYNISFSTKRNIRDLIDSDISYELEKIALSARKKNR